MAFDIRLVGCSGDPTMFEEFWRGTGAAAEIVIPGWQTMSYFSDVGNVCWFLEPGLDQEVRRVHRLVGNAAVDGYHVVVGTGSTQLFMAALYALSPPAGAGAGAAPMSVVSTAPYYSVSFFPPSPMSGGPRVRGPESRPAASVARCGAWVC
jgi:L-tryptophan---pyruvate aminotransferase